MHFNTHQNPVNTDTDLHPRFADGSACSQVKFCMQMTKPTSPRVSWLRLWTWAQGQEQQGHRQCPICPSTHDLSSPQPLLTDPHPPHLQATHSGDKNLCAGGSHGAARHFNVEATFGVLLAPEGRVVEGLVSCLPVAHRLPDGLQDTEQEHATLTLLDSHSHSTPRLTRSSQNTLLWGHRGEGDEAMDQVNTKFSK